MPLHDHPNISVFYNIMYGKLDYWSYDKLDRKYQFNEYASDREFY
jgi:hypothetical protein